SRLCLSQHVKHRLDIPAVLDVLAEAEVTLNLKSSVWAGTKDVPIMGVNWSRGHMSLPPRRSDAMLKMRRHAHFCLETQHLVLPPGALVLRCQKSAQPLGREVIRVTGPYAIARRVADTAYELAHLDGMLLSRADASAG
ncbi:hypothetical protein IWQ57_003943, partial [Coemansia nantahalensis]